MTQSHIFCLTLRFIFNYDIHVCLGSVPFMWPVEVELQVVLSCLMWIQATKQICKISVCSEPLTHLFNPRTDSSTIPLLFPFLPQVVFPTASHYIMLSLPINTAVFF